VYVYSGLKNLNKEMNTDGDGNM